MINHTTLILKSNYSSSSTPFYYSEGEAWNKLTIEMMEMMTIKEASDKGKGLATYWVDTRSD